MRSLTKNASSPEAGKLAGAPRLIAQMALGIIQESSGHREYGILSVIFRGYFLA